MLCREIIIGNRNKVLPRCRDGRNLLCNGYRRFRLVDWATRNLLKNQNAAGDFCARAFNNVDGNNDGRRRRRGARSYGEGRHGRSESAGCVSRGFA